MNVQVQFIDSELSLISVPISKAPLITQGLIKLCLKLWRTRDLSDSQLLDSDNLRHGQTDDDSDNDEDQDEFFNITFTPYECSIICNSDLVDSLFGILLEHIPDSKLNPETFMGIKIDCQGVDSPSRRILDLSSPLSEENIPIFFLSTYFSDYMLVPTTSKSHVTQILFEKGFSFSSLENSYVAVRAETPKKPALQSLTNLTDLLTVSTKALELVLTGTRSSYDADAIEMAVVKEIVDQPSFFSITMHSAETTFVIEKRKLALWPKDSLLGTLEEPLSPILLDLRSIPIDTVGVVAHISRLLVDEGISMSFLSTFLSSIVLINTDSLEKTKRVLFKK